jgi:hypothetical protein
MFFEHVFDRDMWLSRPMIKLSLGDAIDEISKRIEFAVASGKEFELVEEEMQSIPDIHGLSRKCISVIIKDRIGRLERKVSLYSKLQKISDIIHEIVFSPTDIRKSLIIKLSGKSEYQDAIKYFNNKQFTIYG